MNYDASFASEGDSAPPATALIQIKDTLDNNNNKPNLEETKYPIENDNFINNSNGIIQNKINSFQSNENKTPHDKSFKGQNELMNLYKEMHKFRCGKCGIFFEIKEEMDDHFRIYEKNKLKDNKNKYS